jgi:uncharacterized protein (DUF169 family)
VKQVDSKRINALGKDLDSFLRLETHSLGIKFFEKISDVPQDYQVFDSEQPVCAVFGWSRFPEIPFPVSEQVLKRRFPNFS